MALPTSRERTYGKQAQQIDEADLNAIQTWIKNLYDGQHAERIRIHEARTANLSVNFAKSDEYILASGNASAHIRIPAKASETVTRIGGFVHRADAGDTITIILGKIDLTAGTVAEPATATGATVGGWVNIVWTGSVSVSATEAMTLECRVLGTNGSRCAYMYYGLTGA